MPKAKRNGNKTDSVNKRLSHAYFTASLPSSFGGKKKLIRGLKGSPKINDPVVTKWLTNRDSYTLHRPVRKRFPRRKYIVNGIDDLWQVDLTDLTALSTHNDGKKYILFVIDVFTRKLFARIMKTKTGRETSEAFEDIILTEGRSPNNLQSDQGKEFLNTQFQRVLKTYDTNHYTSKNQEIKASLVERVQRTIKGMMYRYFTHTNSYRYIDSLPQLVDSYNNTFHSAINLAPNDITSDNQESVWLFQYNPARPPKVVRHKFKIGDTVRISKYSMIFDKGYLPNWSAEVFKIARLYNTDPPVYSLKDHSGEELNGTFYEAELQRVSVFDDTYKIESILGQRKVRGKVQYLVRWLGYPPSYNSYVDRASLIQNYNN